MVSIQEYDVAYRLLRNFGSLIERIWVLFDLMDAQNGVEIIRSLNHYCFDSIKEIMFKQCGGNALEGLKKPFLRCEKVIFSSDAFGEISKKTKKFNEIFPNIKHLTIEYIKQSDFIILDSLFPKLNLFHLTFEKMYATPKFLIDFLKQHNHIKFLSLRKPDLLFLKQANEILTKYDSLIILDANKYFTNSNIDTIKFRTVKYLKIKPGENLDKITDKLIFERLEELTFEMEEYFIEQWITFLNNQVDMHLKTLKIYTKQLSAEHILAIPDKFFELEIIKIRCKEKLAVTDVIQFLKKCKLLQQLDMFIPFDRNELIKFHELLPINWYIYYMKQPREDKVILVLKR